MNIVWPQNILDNKIETSLNLFSLFVSRGLSFHDTQTQISKNQTLEINKEKKV